MNSFGARAALTPGGPEIYRLDVLEKTGVGPVSRLPYAMKILLENLLRLGARAGSAARGEARLVGRGAGD